LVDYVVLLFQIRLNFLETLPTSA